MNKQEQIEKMIDVVTCNRCRQFDQFTKSISNRCPEAHGEDCDRRTRLGNYMSNLYEASYINGADFVEWLKSSRFVKPYMDDVDYCMGIDIEVLAEALQEYMK